MNAPYVAKLTGIAVGEHLMAMHEMGVRIITGTDAGIDNTPHHQYVGALEYLVSLGFQPGEVLAMATTEAAAALGVGAITGRLAPGYDADLIVVDGDPRTDIAVLGKLHRVPRAATIGLAAPFSRPGTLAGAQEQGAIL